MLQNQQKSIPLYFVKVCHLRDVLAQISDKKEQEKILTNSKSVQTAVQVQKPSK